MGPARPGPTRTAMTHRDVILAATAALLLQTTPAQPPTTAAEVGAWDAAIVRHAAALIPTPAQWDRAATADCSVQSTRFSLQCALQRASDSAGAGQPVMSECVFRSSSGGWEGTCGPLFDERSIFSVTRTAGVKTGVWRRDASP